MYRLKNTSILIICILLQSLFLTACGKGVPALSESDFILTSAQTTTENIGVGSTLDEFLLAYPDVPLFVSEEGTEYHVADRELLSTNQNMNIILSSFFIDEKVCDTDAFCTANEIEKENLLDYVNTEDFLSTHTVVYRYISFDFSDGVITNLTSDELDFNAELSYDQERAN